MRQLAFTGGRAGHASLALAGAALIVAVALAVKGVLPWTGLVDWSRRWGPASAVAVIGFACVVSGARAMRNREARELRPIRWWLALAAAVAVVAGTWLACATLRVDRIPAGPAIGAGAVLVLLLLARRQWLSERVQAHLECDTTERRATEVYAETAERLASGKGPVVCLAALYTLDRLGQENAGHRQAVVNIVCGYLRMPAEDTDLEARLTAQRLLAGHLSPGAAFWPGMDLDLTGATLVDFDLSACHAGDARFTGARFRGRLDLSSARFRAAMFDNADFEGIVNFANTTFGSVAGFAGARFHEKADFSHVMFEQEPDLTGALARRGSHSRWPDGWTSQNAGTWHVLAPGQDRPAQELE